MIICFCVQFKDASTCIKVNYLLKCSLFYSHYFPINKLWPYIFQKLVICMYQDYFEILGETHNLSTNYQYVWKGFAASQFSC